MSYIYYSANKDGDDEVIDVFEVGHYTPKGQFIMESFWGTRAEATAQVCYLNGGAHPQRNLEYGL